MPYPAFAQLLATPRLLPGGLAVCPSAAAARGASSGTQEHQGPNRCNERGRGEGTVAPVMRRLAVTDAPFVMARVNAGLLRGLRIHATIVGPATAHAANMCALCTAQGLGTCNEAARCHIHRGVDGVVVIKARCRFTTHGDRNIVEDRGVVRMRHIVVVLRAFNVDFSCPAIAAHVALLSRLRTHLIAGFTGLSTHPRAHIRRRR